jgi:hypothetical protein
MQGSFGRAKCARPQDDKGVGGLEWEGARKRL